MTPAERAELFWAKVSKTSGCWEWTASLFPMGYGQFGVGGHRVTGAHRFSWVLANGPIPDGLHVCHRCDNRRCVRPDHLFLGTAKDNMRDMRAKGRHPIGLDEETVREVLCLRGLGIGPTWIARALGVHRCTIHRATRRAQVSA